MPLFEKYIHVAGSSMMPRLFQPPNGAVSVTSNPSLNAQAVEVASCVLSCLAHLFSWIPLSSTITPVLLNNIFQYAVFGSADHASTGTAGKGECYLKLACTMYSIYFAAATK